MKSLKNFIIYESLDSDNIEWKVDTWFQGNDLQRKLFKSFMSKCSTNNNSTSIDKDDLSDFMDFGDFNYKEFVDFLYDNISSNTVDFDYKYALETIIKLLLGNKSYTI